MTTPCHAPSRFRRFRTPLWACLVVLGLHVGAPAALAAGPPSLGTWLHRVFSEPTELGLRLGWVDDIGELREAKFYYGGGRLAFDLVDPIPEIAGNRVRLGVELGAAHVEDETNDRRHVEIAFTPLLFDWRWDAPHRRIVPFVEGGEGLVYNTLDGYGLGQSLLFSSQAGAGFHLFWNDRDALTVSARFRHISNAGLATPNAGMNTMHLTIGWTHFPKR